MKLRITKHRLAISCCALTSVLPVLLTLMAWTNYQHNDTSLLPVLKLGSYFNRPTQTNTSTAFQLQDPIRFANETDFDCVRAELDHLEFPFCTYNEEDDIHISGVFLRGHYFERHSVLKTVNFMKNHHDITFLDIGANLGSYSLPVAHVGRHVVAVEPNWDTLRRLAKSVHLGSISTNIDLLPHAIAAKRSNTFMKFFPNNRGRTEISNKTSCEKNCVNVSVSVITLNDILPLMRNKKAIIKVDVEGSEINVFTPSSANDFFREVDVLIIQMEWTFYPMYFTQTPEKRRLVDEFLNFFYDKGYVIYNAYGEQMLPSNWTTWPDDICLTKGRKSGGLYDI